MSSDEKFESLEYETPRKPGVYVISKPRLYALTFATLILILMVGILSGVLAAKSAREEVKKDYEAKTDKQGKNFLEMNFILTIFGSSD